MIFVHFLLNSWDFDFTHQVAELTATEKEDIGVG